MVKRVVLSDLKTDRYGRIMATVYFDKKSVNEYMIKNRFAFRSADHSVLKEEYLQANNYAREHKLGIFSSKCRQTGLCNKGKHNPIYKHKGICITRVQQVFFNNSGKV